MRMETRRFLHDIVAEVFGLPKNKVIWSQRNGVKQAVPFVTLKAYSHVAEAREEVRFTKDPGVLDLRTPTAFVLEVRYFGDEDSYPVDIVDTFVRCLEKPTVLDKCFINGVAFLYADHVQDITSLLGNSHQYEPAAAVDLHCRFTASIIDEPGYIDTVDIHSEYSPEPEPTPTPTPGPDPEPSPGPDPTPTPLPEKGGWLIYGKINVEGKTSDLERAIPVNVYATIREDDKDEEEE